MLRTLSYASCYAYSPHGRGPVSQRSRVLRTLLKSRDPAFIYRYGACVAEAVREGTVLRGFFEATALLIPVPGCAPRAVSGKWIAGHLANALYAAGLGAGVWAGLRREHAVRKSATAAGGRRPTVALHYDSFALESPPAGSGTVSILLIDDVVTKGRTLLAAATRVREAFPETPIRAFALLRTQGMVAEIDRLMDPCVGTIRWRAGDADRSP